MSISTTLIGAIRLFRYSRNRWPYWMFCKTWQFLTATNKFVGHKECKPHFCSSLVLHEGIQSVMILWLNALRQALIWWWTLHKLTMVRGRDIRLRALGAFVDVYTLTQVRREGVNSNHFMSGSVEIAVPGDGRIFDASEDSVQGYLVNIAREHEIVSATHLRIGARHVFEICQPLLVVSHDITKWVVFICRIDVVIFAWPHILCTSVSKYCTYKGKYREAVPRPWCNCWENRDSKRIRLPFYP